MLGLLIIAFTLLMIYTLVKNALFGKQINSADQFSGPIDLILPVTIDTKFSGSDWQKALTNIRGTSLRIHVLIDGHHGAMESWNNLSQNYPQVEIHSFLTRPQETNVSTWMMAQIHHRIQGEVVIIGQPDLVPSESLFSSLAKIVKDKERSYLTLPQTAKKNMLGEAVALLNPTLALASFYGFQKFRRSLSYPFLSLSDGWLAMPLGVFKEIPFANLRGDWKESIIKSIDAQGGKVYLSFGEKHLLRSYPDFFEDYIRSMRDDWSDLWNKHDRKSFWFFVITLFIWSFPIVCLFTHPFWAIGSLFLLILYRFFSKIVFQESWGAVILHPVACLTWMTTLFWWLGTSARNKSGTLRKN